MNRERRGENMIITHNRPQATSQALFNTALISEKYFTSYGKPEIGCICPNCKTLNFHGLKNLEIARCCFFCGKNYLIAGAE